MVTGAGQGIGFERCSQLAYHGASVTLNDIDAKRAKEAAAKINKEGGRCTAVSGDFSDINFIKELLSAAVNNYGRLDVAIANSGITLFGDFLEYPAESFYRVLNVNLGGSFFLAQQAAKQMIKQNSADLYCSWHL